MMFFDDRLAMPGIFGGSVAEAVRYGARPVKLDLSIVLGVIAGDDQPHRARRHLLDDLLPRRSTWPAPSPRSTTSPGAGRRGTSSRRSTTARPRTSASKQALGHDERYDRADEFLEAVVALWDSWEDDALDPRPGQRRVRRPRQGPPARLRGHWFNTAGPLTVPRSPQGRPVLLQAGSSGRGRDFAARWAEVIFTGDPAIDVARSHYKDQKDRIAADGARPGLGEDAADGLHGRGGVDAPTPRSASRPSSTTSSTRWPR